jgi:quinol monooxygenase YgiN
MRLIRVLLLGGAMLMAAEVLPARAQTPTAAPGFYVINYFEVPPSAAVKVDALLHDYGVASRKEGGNAEVTAVHQVGRSGHFAIVEAWRDKVAYEAHMPALKALGDQLQPLFSSPLDGRQFTPLSIAPPASGADLGAAMYVLTHVDVFPAGKDDVAALVKTQVEESRKDPGVQRFDAVVWDGHPNHFHLIEAWADHLAQEKHALAEHTKQFRAKLVPFEGALYDERLYEVVR